MWRRNETGGWRSQTQFESHPGGSPSNTEDRDLRVGPRRQRGAPPDAVRIQPWRVATKYGGQRAPEWDREGATLRLPFAPREVGAFVAPERDQRWQSQAQYQYLHARNDAGIKAATARISTA